ncbi:MAG: hypothetical protein ACKVRP_00375 [Bacteroidota bacterium]
MTIKDITPRSFNCGVGACPSIYETDRDSYLIVGSSLGSENQESLAPLRVGINETVVEVPKRLILDLLRKE